MLQLGYFGFGGSSVPPSVWPNMPWPHSRPRELLLVFQFEPPRIELGAAPAHLLRKFVNRGRPPVGIVLLGLHQLPNPPTELVRRSMTSCGESLLLSKSPIFHSPKAMVLLVPS